MRRKGPPIDEHPIKQYEIHTDIEVERLAAIGALTLAWNDLEGAVDGAAGLSLMLVEPLWVEVTSRINGFDGKIAIIKQGLNINFKLPANHARTIATTLGAAETHKRLRDGIIHAMILDPTAAVAPTIQRKGRTDEVLVTLPAIQALYERIVMLRGELDVVVWFLANMSMYHGRPLPTSPAEKKRSLAQVQRCMPLLAHRQKKREALPPLPDFPASRTAQPRSTEPPTPPE